MAFRKERKNLDAKSRFRELLKTRTKKGVQPTKENILLLLCYILKKKKTARSTSALNIKESRHSNRKTQMVLRKIG